MAVTVFGDAHCDRIFMDLSLAPYLDLLEITRSPNHLMISLERNTIGRAKRDLCSAKQYVFVKQYGLHRKKRLPLPPVLLSFCIAYRLSSFCKAPLLDLQ